MGFYLSQLHLDKPVTLCGVIGEFTHLARPFTGA